MICRMAELLQKIKKLGVQLLTLRKCIKTEEDMRETLKNVKNIGYDSIYLNDGGSIYQQTVQLAKEAGLEIIGTAYDGKTLREEKARVLENAALSGSYQVGIHKEVIHSAEGYAQFCEQINEFGKILSQKQGKFIYNQHAREFCVMDGKKTGMDLLKEYTDPNVVSFGVNTFWLQNAGVDIRHFLEEYAGRIEILRMQDCTIAMDYFRQSLPLGSGNMYWDGIIEAAAEAGVAHYIVEDEKCLANILDVLEKSSQFIHENYM